MSFALMVAAIIQGQLVHNFYMMNSIDECRLIKTIMIMEKNVVEAHCAAVITEMKKPEKN